MSAKILNPIPQQNYELVRDRIAEILFTELENQYFLTYNQDFNIAAVWVERSSPFDHTECPTVNVSFGTGSFDNKDNKNIDGTYLFNIDCFTKAKATEGQSINGGDQRSTLKLHRLMGLVRAILSNPQYNTLSFAKPSISNVHVVSMDIADSKSDSENVAMGRVVLSVRIPEVCELKSANVIDGTDTAVKMNLTDKGYVFTGSNPIIPPDTCDPATIYINGVYYTIISSGSTQNIIVEYANGNPVSVSFDYDKLIIPDDTGAAIWGELWP